MDDWAGRYLALLGLKSSKPSLHNLKSIAAAHSGVVFANATSLMRRQATPEGAVPALATGAMLDTWEQTSVGGVCFEVATMSSGLLTRLGFDAHVVIGEIAFRGHQAVIVNIEGRRYLLDLGNGAPLFEPIPLDDGPYEVSCAGLNYRFSRLPDGSQHLQERWINGAWQAFARYDLEPALVDERASSYQRHLLLPAQSFVMANFVVVQCHDDQVLQLGGHTFTVHRSSGKTSREVHGVAEYRALIRDSFDLPDFPVDEALEA